MTLRALGAALLLLEAVASTTMAGVDRWLWPHEMSDQHRYREVAAFVDRNTAPGDTLLVWGNSPEIYWYARRLPATRYLSANYQTGHVWGTSSNRNHAVGDPTATSPRAWSLLLADLDRAPPALIIDAAAGGLDNMEQEPLARQPLLHPWLEAHYRQASTIAGVPIYERRGARPSHVAAGEM